MLAYRVECNGRGRGDELRPRCRGRFTRDFIAGGWLDVTHRLLDGLAMLAGPRRLGESGRLRDSHRLAGRGARFEQLAVLRFSRQGFARRAIAALGTLAALTATTPATAAALALAIVALGRLGVGNRPGLDR